MSNKPLKASDQKKLDEMMLKKKRQIETMHILPPYTYIISEGVKTEPNYISGLVDTINAKYQQYSRGKRIVIEGTGRNTRSLLEYARKSVENNFPEATIVWLMYDKDDFPYDDFDNTQFSAEGKLDERRIYKTAWSNECIELWFILHFQDLATNVGRKNYRKILKTYLVYEKNLKNIYEILKDNTDIAISRAKKQYCNYEDKTPSRCCPATRVYELVEELQTYL